MDPNLSKALLLLFVGMITVFSILSLVVLIGKVLIYIINRFIPVQEKKLKSQKINRGLPVEDPSIDPKQLAAIVAAVATITGGKGRVTSIERG